MNGVFAARSGSDGNALRPVLCELLALQAVLIFRPNANRGPATELRLDRGGGHFILKRE